MSERPALTSLQNPAIKQLVKLRDSRERRKSGLTRIDGGRELLRCLEAGLLPETVYFCPGRVRGPEAARALELCAHREVALQEIGPAVYEKIVFGERDEGLCATVRWSARTLESLQPGAPAFVVVIEGIEKPGNLGALLRTADGAGVDAVILSDPACDPGNPNVVRSSMGTLFALPLAVATADEVRDWIRAHGIAMITTRPEAERRYDQVDVRGPIAIVLGAEHCGLSASWDVEDAIPVRLPMAGVADSLNLSAAAAILLYDVVRQRS